MATLVTFLGTTDYKKLQYHFEDKEFSTRYVAAALCHFFPVEHVVVLATEDAEKTHGTQLHQALAGRNVSFRRIPYGDGPQVLRDQFGILLDALNVHEDDALILDITHGFRAQSFFAATALATLQAAGKLPRDVRIVYGAAPFPSKDGDPAPIWELSPFFNRLNEAFGAKTFLHTGDASLFVDALLQADDNLRRRARQMGQDTAELKTRPLIRALKRFTEELKLLRVPALTIGFEDRPASSALLLTALEQYADSCRDEHPALALLLQDIQQMIQPLPCETLADRKGHEALLHLAKLFMKWGQYAEAANVAREGLVCLYADDASGTDAGFSLFSKEAREEAEERTRAYRENRIVAGIRNTIEHCAFQEMPEFRRREQAHWDPERTHPLRRDLDRLMQVFEQQVKNGNHQG